MMKLGACAKITQLECIKSLGYDYAEFALNATSKWSDEELDAAQDALKRTQLRAEVFNGFCSSDLRLSYDVDTDAIRAYCQMALPRAERLGCELLVVGSGGARKYPEAIDPSEAKENFKRALCTIADVASAHGIKVAIEPLNRKETNLANTVAETAAICEEIGSEDVGFIADLFHVYKNGEDLADITTYGEHILHAHIARRNDDRHIPCKEDAADLTEFLAALQNAKQCKRMSLEGKFYPDFESAVQEFYELWTAATKN
jgi:sugar phosphate isomerase/epimerase